MIALFLSVMLMPAAEGSLPPPSIAPTEKISVLVLDLQSSKVAEAEVAVLNDILGQSVSRVPDSEVMTTADVRRVAGVEAQKQLMGCDDSSCLVDLADDFGARFIVFGSAAVLGESYVIQLTLFDSEKATVVERSRFETADLTGVSAKIDGAVQEIFAPVRTIVPVAEEGSNAGLYLASGGALLATIGAAGLVVGALQGAKHRELQEELALLETEFRENAASREEKLGEANQKNLDAERARTLANTATLTGAIAAAAGAIAMSGGLVWFFAGGEE